MAASIAGSPAWAGMAFILKSLRRLMRQDEGFVGVYCGPGDVEGKAVGAFAPLRPTLRSNAGSSGPPYFVPIPFRTCRHGPRHARDAPGRRIAENSCRSCWKAPLQDLEVFGSRNITTGDGTDTQRKACLCPQSLFWIVQRTSLRPDWHGSRLCGKGRMRFPLYGEPSAPQNPQCILNGMTQVSSCHACG